jgi:L-fucose isomerase-like protein
VKGCGCVMEKSKTCQSLVLGIAPVSRKAYVNEPALRQKELLYDQLKSYPLKTVTLDGICPDGLLKSTEDAQKAARFFIAEDIDALFIPFCDYGDEGSAAVLARLTGKPLLIWAPRDDPPDSMGLRTRNAQCGIFAASKVISLMGIPFSYITNSSVQDAVFDRGLQNFVRSAAVVKAFHSMRIGQISTRPEPFWCVMYNEAELLERFGIQVVPTPLASIEKAVGMILEYNSAVLKDTVEDMRMRFTVQVEDKALKTMAALKLALLDWVKQEHLSGIAMQCWSALNISLGIVPCLVNGELTSMGIPVACETDIHGAVSSIILQAAALWESPSFLADLTMRHPERDDAELLWHCGNFPSELACEDREKYVREQHSKHYPGIGNWEIKGGDITLCRFGGAKGRYSLLMGETKGVQGPYCWGTYVYVGVKNWPLWERKIVYGPYIHHCAGVHGRFAPALYEACRFIPGLEPDPVEPGMDEIERMIRE